LAKNGDNNTGVGKIAQEKLYDTYMRISMRVKQSLAQAWIDPEGSRRLRHFMTIGT
jgi:hypothetical protein